MPMLPEIARCQNVIRYLEQPNKSLATVKLCQVLILKPWEESRSHICNRVALKNYRHDE